MELKVIFIPLLSFEIAAICSERSQREGVVVNAVRKLHLTTCSAFENPKRESRKGGFVIWIAIQLLQDFLDLAFVEAVILVQIQQSIRSIDVSNENGPDDAVISAIVSFDEAAKTLESNRVEQGFKVLVKSEDFGIFFLDFVYQRSCPLAEDQGVCDPAFGDSLHWYDLL